ncbi:Glyoxalase/Bleomycin resistance protein/Dihydroxybiphenyl dioxygenase [Phlegmacium glaucopus]|nr:Glyoxalase/Bleomycin resistance protein/Dihydroxybiphenyl dioxygenase [Phlegmacium glaucopus]
MPIHHISFRAADFSKTRDFYLAALKPLGYKIIMSFHEGKVLGLGAKFYAPDFWLVDPDVTTEVDKASSEKPAPSGPLHIAFSASNRAQVREFYEAAIAAGGKCNGPPGVRKEYCSMYYGAFVTDPEGRNIEAVCLKPAFWAEPWGWVGWSAAGTLACAIGGGIGKWAGLI